VDIGLKKQNANLLLANLLLHLNETDNIYLNSFNGGTKDNVICYESVVTFSYNNKDIENKINEYFKTINFIKEDQNYQWNLEKIDKQKVLSNERTIKILNLITNLKQNVITYDNELNMVKTSANIGVIKTENNILNLTLSLRSNDNIEKEKYIKINDEIAHKYEFKIEHIREYPGWDYNKDNKLISIYEKEYSKVFKNKLNLMTIHAGLECGIIYKKTGIKNMISVGPNIYDVHSIREHLDLKSYYKILEVIIKTINDINC
jgi:dipeptidase D